MKRALTVAAALVHRPRLLFLDEPTTGLDVLSAHSLRALIERLQEAGVTIFLTTHYLEEAERLCDRVALNTVRPTLEDAFIELTGLSAEVMRVEKGGQ